MALPALLPLLGRMFAGGARGGAAGMMGDMFGMGKRAAAKPPPIDPNDFVGRQNWESERKGSKGPSLGGIGAMAGIAQAIDPLKGVRKEIAGMGREAVKGTLGIAVFNKIFQKTFSMLPVNQLRELGNAMGAFISKISPAHLTKFNYQMDRINATIGNMLIPVFDSLIKYANFLGDALAGWKPVFDPLLQVISSLINREGAGLSALFTRMAPIVQQVVDTLIPVINAISAMSDVFMALPLTMHPLVGVFRFFLGYIEIMAKVVTFVAKAFAVAITFISGFVKAIMKMLGFNVESKSRYDPKKKANAPIQTATVSSVKDFSDRAFEKSAQMSVLGETDQSHEKTVENYLHNLPTLADVTKNAEDVAKKVVDAITNLPDKIATALKSLIPDVPKLPSSVGGAVSSAASSGLAGPGLMLIDELRRQAVKRFGI